MSSWKSTFLNWGLLTRLCEPEHFDHFPISKTMGAPLLFYTKFKVCCSVSGYKDTWLPCALLVNCFPELKATLNCQIPLVFFSLYSNCEIWLSLQINRCHCCHKLNINLFVLVKYLLSKSRWKNGPLQVVNDVLLTQHGHY